ncbi:Cif family virulence factor [Paenibacillus cymbidii]|uniref:DUF4440 domain-containing protein n=1 Tax=Paenibacillus cymbidii TaxID=1639034 RepID=UPI001081ECC0|nr:DUF4440 domain-containing protein [Paenibacillus cymbidii]
MTVQELFDRYERALEAGDIEGVAAAYGQQALMSGPDGVYYIENNDGFREALRQASSFYKSIGVASIGRRKFTEAPLGDDHMLVKVNWKLEFATGDPVDFDMTYVVRCNPGGEPHFVFLIAHNEEERLRESGRKWKA